MAVHARRILSCIFSKIVEISQSTCFFKYFYKEKLSDIRFSNRVIKKNSDDLENSKNIKLKKMFCLSFDPSKRIIFSFDFFVS